MTAPERGERPQRKSDLSDEQLQALADLITAKLRKRLEQLKRANRDWS